MPSIVLKDKQAKIFLSLKNTQQPWHISNLATSCGATYVHTHNFIKLCESLGLTTIEKHGKLKEIKLTEKGMQMAEMITNIYTIITPPQAQQKQEENGKKEEKKEEKK